MKRLAQIWTVALCLVLSAVVGIGQDEFTSSLPIIVLNTGDEEIPDEPKISATMGIVFDKDGGGNVSSGEFNHFEGQIGIETRGNSTQRFHKKSYSIELRDEHGNPSGWPLVGMPSDSEWVLHAMFIDKSLLRIPLSFDLSSEMGQYASDWRFVELILNGKYRGVYALVEKIKQGPNRVDIAPNTKADETGGYILRIDWDEGGAGFDSEYPSMGGQDLRIQYHYPKGSLVTDSQEDYISSYVDRFEDAVFSMDHTNLQGEHFSELSDMESFVDFLLINELSKNSDGYKLSTYFHKDREDINNRLKAGPIWDFDQTYGLSVICSGHNYCGWTYLQNLDRCENLSTMPLWWEHMTRDLGFTQLLVDRWEMFRATFLSENEINERIDKLAEQIEEAQVRNFDRWDILGTAVWDEPEEPVRLTWEDEIEYLKSWIKKRSEWMDRNIEVIYQMANAKNGVVAFPNPSSAQTNIVGVPGSSIHVCDTYGRPVWTAGTCTESSFTFDVSGWVPGYYIVYVLSTQGVHSGKLVVQ